MLRLPLPRGLRDDGSICRLAPPASFKRRIADGLRKPSPPRVRTTRCRLIPAMLIIGPILVSQTSSQIYRAGEMPSLEACIERRHFSAIMTRSFIAADGSFMMNFKIA